MIVLQHLGKSNVVADALTRVSLGSVSRVEEEKRELARDVHRLARFSVRLGDSPKGGVMIRHNFESSVVDVKSKQNLDQILMELKKFVLKKTIETFSQREDGVFRHQGGLCVPDVDGLRKPILEQAHGSRYSIQGPPKSIMTYARTIGGTE